MHMPCKASKEHMAEGRMVNAFSIRAVGLVIQQEVILVSAKFSGLYHILTEPCQSV